MSGALIQTVRERCRLCFTCVRECPAKAIRIEAGQAEVVAHRCIGCGNCVQVCSQDAKRPRRDVERVEALLKTGDPVAAIIAPSFPAEFEGVDPKRLVGALRELGFALVVEVAFAADIVAEAYQKLLSEAGPDRAFIATTCPAVVSFVERYHPQLVDRLAPIVSPMVAAARALREIHGDSLKVAFIGPCLAKKHEADGGLSGAPTLEPAEADDLPGELDGTRGELDGTRGEIDGALTFIELNELFGRRGVDVDEARPSGFDPPRAGQGTLFPLSGGMLQAANIREDLLTGAVVSAEGRSSFLEALKAFDSGELDVRLLDLLCCNGCIMGAGMSSKAPYFRRRALISRYAQRRVASRNGHGFSVDHNRLLAELSLSCSFQSRDQMAYEPNEHDIREIMSRMGKSGATDELDCGACGYETCREHAMAIFNGLAESEMCLPYTIEQLKHTCDELTRSHSELESTQEALMQAEKLASMGQLAAGIAHEVNNPLGTVLMLSHLMLEDTREDDENRADLELMASEALRCKKIVSGLLQFARKNKVDASSIDLQGLLERFAATVRDRSGVEIAVERRIDNARAEVDADQIMQVIVNLGSNALDAMGGKGTLTLATDGDDEQIQVIVSDTGCGIPASLSKKIFEPFFTTKHSGQGTGLGLSVTYGIVKMHHGDIRMQSNDDPAKGPLGTTFTVTMPRRRRPKEEVALATANGAGPQNGASHG